MFWCCIQGFTCKGNTICWWYIYSWDLNTKISNLKPWVETTTKWRGKRLLSESYYLKYQMGDCIFIAVLVKTLTLTAGCPECEWGIPVTNLCYLHILYLQKLWHCNSGSLVLLNGPIATKQTFSSFFHFKTAKTAVAHVSMYEHCNLESCEWDRCLCSTELAHCSKGEFWGMADQQWDWWSVCTTLTTVSLAVALWLSRGQAHHERTVTHGNEADTD